MPELPEVETVARGLAAAVEGRRIERAEARRPDLRFPLPPDLSVRVKGRRLERIAAGRNTCCSIWMTAR